MYPRVVGLVIDQRTQGRHTEARPDAWVAQVRPLMQDRLLLAT
jgi:flavodoxin I